MVCLLYNPEPTRRHNDQAPEYFEECQKSWLAIDHPYPTKRNVLQPSASFCSQTVRSFQRIRRRNICSGALPMIILSQNNFLLNTPQHYQRLFEGKGANVKILTFYSRNFGECLNKWHNITLATYLNRSIFMNINIYTCMSAVQV